MKLSEQFKDANDNFFPYENEVITYCKRCVLEALIKYCNSYIDNAEETDSYVHMMENDRNKFQHELNVLAAEAGIKQK